MYTEGFEDLEESENSSRRTYISNVSQDDAEMLMRENDRLTKALEKEQFFNKLLDQEIQELKTKQGHADQPYHSEYWYGNRGVSKGAFYTLLVITLLMAGYIGYGIYYDKQFDYIKNITPPPTAASDEAAPTFTTPSGNSASTTAGEAQPKASEPINNNTPVTPPPSAPRVKDSVPNIVFEKKEAVVKNEKPVVKQETAAAAEEMDVESARGQFPSEPVDTRPVIARYQVTSKANFYNAADENTMKGTFISPGVDKVVGALEEKNGFIYVVYTNDLGYTSKGWLSVKDLSKMD